MKSIFRLVVFGLLVGGWSLAASSLYVVRTGDQRLVVVPKDHLSFKDTYVDTRHWTLTNVRQHATVVSRLIYLNKADQLANTTVAGNGPVEAQLIDAVQHPEVAPVTTQPEYERAADRVKAEVHSATQNAKSVIDF